MRCPWDSPATVVTGTEVFPRHHLPGSCPLGEGLALHRGQGCQHTLHVSADGQLILKRHFLQGEINI